ncbi:unnamed protein product [Rhizophagus irregularis]|nr:unnamed protein product [Rhizophagus irregularis]CAB5392131.1 unnamed protein product [Rhizophagus irregularis]
MENQKTILLTCSKMVMEGWDAININMIRRSFKCCGVSNAIYGTEDTLIFDFDRLENRVIEKILEVEGERNENDSDYDKSESEESGESEIEDSDESESGDSNESESGDSNESEADCNSGLELIIRLMPLCILLW